MVETRKKRDSKEKKMLSLLRSKTARKRTIMVGLKSDHCSREILLRLLALVVKQGDNVVAVHVQEAYDAFNPNTFHIHEDICKYKQIDFQVNVCQGDSYISELTHQVRVNYAAILVLGSCNPSGPKEAVLSTCLKSLPPTCTLLVMDNGGKIILEKQGTCQQGSPRLSASKKSDTSLLISNYTEPNASLKNGSNIKVSDFILGHNPFDKMSPVNVTVSIHNFSLQELIQATDNFNPALVIGEGENSKVYQARLECGRAIAVKVLSTHLSTEDLLREVEMLSRVQHENIIRIVGCCNCMEINAIVYDLLKGSLKRYLRQLRWGERMGVAIGVAKALKYLHHSRNPPIVHRDVKSSNILLSHNSQPQLSDFGGAIVLEPSRSDSKRFDVFGTFGYLAPENVMYGDVDEKIDVYSYGVVLLELITGKEAIKTDQPNHESLVLWARSLLRCGLGDSLIDPHLNEDYNKKEIDIMMMAARLCLLHSSSTRPSMETVLRLFEEPDYSLKMQIADGERGV